VTRLLRYTSLVVTAGLVALPTLASAAIQVGQPTKGLGGSGSHYQTLGALFGRAFDLIIMVAGIIFVVLLLVGGIMYMTSMGNEDGTKKARQLMLDAVIGLVIVVAAWAVGNFVLTQLGINITSADLTT